MVMQSEPLKTGFLVSEEDGSPEDLPVRLRFPNGSVTRTLSNELSVDFVGGSLPTTYLKLNQTTPQTFTNLGVGTGLLKITAGLLGLDTNTYLTAEADTLASVTARGATTAVASSFTNGLSVNTGITLDSEAKISAETLVNSGARILVTSLDSNSPIAYKFYPQGYPTTTFLDLGNTGSWMEFFGYDDVADSKYSRLIFATTRTAGNYIISSGAGSGVSIPDLHFSTTATATTLKRMSIMGAGTYAGFIFDYTTHMWYESPTATTQFGQIRFLGGTNNFFNIGAYKPSPATWMDVVIGQTTKPVRFYGATGDMSTALDNAKIMQGTANDAGSYYDGTNWLFNPKLVGTGYMNIKGQLLMDDKIMFTQTDGNEYIDSLADGYLDLGATTAIRVKNILLAEDKISFTQTDNNEYIDSLNDGYMDYGATTAHRFNNPMFIANMKSGATQAAASASANELWKTASHVTLPDNVVMIGV